MIDALLNTLKNQDWKVRKAIYEALQLFDLSIQPILLMPEIIQSTCFYSTSLSAFIQQYLNTDQHDYLKMTIAKCISENTICYFTTKCCYVHDTKFKAFQSFLVPNGHQLQTKLIKIRRQLLGQTFDEPALLTAPSVISPSELYGNIDGNTPWHQAALNNDLKALKESYQKLLNLGFELKDLMQHRKIRSVHSLLDSTQNDNLPPSVTTPNAEGQTALDLTQQSDCLTVLKAVQQTEQNYYQQFTHLLHNRIRVAKDRLEQLMQHCADHYQGSFALQLQDRRVLDQVIYELLAIDVPEGDNDVLTLDDTLRVKYFAQLYSVQGELEELKYKADSRKSKQQKEGEGKQESLQGWYPEDYLPLRIRALLEMLVKIKVGKLKPKEELLIDKEIIFPRLLNELYVQIETYWAYVCVDMIACHPKVYRPALLKAHVDNTVDHLSRLSVGECYVYHSGSEIHTLYVRFQCLAIRNQQSGEVHPSLVIFIYNCGNGVYGRIGQEKRHEIIVTQKNVEKTRPALLGYLPIATLKQKDSRKRLALGNYIQGLAESQKEPEKPNKYRKVYSKSFKAVLYSLTYKELAKQAPQPRTIQLAENCVVYNHCSQLHDALLLPNQPDPHVLYNWVIQQEMDYITRTKQKGLRQRVMPSPSTSSQTHSKNSPQSSEQHLAKPTPTPSSNELPPKPSLRSISQQNLWTSTDSSSSSEEEKENNHPKKFYLNLRKKSNNIPCLGNHISKQAKVEQLKGKVQFHFSQ